MIFVNPVKMSNGRMGGTCYQCKEAKIPLLSAYVSVESIHGGWGIEEKVLCLDCVLLPASMGETLLVCPSCNTVKPQFDTWRNDKGEGLRYVCEDCFKKNTAFCEICRRKKDYVEAVVFVALTRELLCALHAKDVKEVTYKLTKEPRDG